MPKKFTVPNLQQHLSQIPAGKVVTYAELARVFGSPRAARAVGTLCARNPEPDKYPCFKVVKSDGTIGNYSLGSKEKIRRLEAEGVIIQKNRIVNFTAKKYRFPK